jgi:hypothetical protein
MASHLPDGFWRMRLDAAVLVGVWKSISASDPSRGQELEFDPVSSFIETSWQKIVVELNAADQGIARRAGPG